MSIVIRPCPPSALPALPGAAAPLPPLFHAPNARCFAAFQGDAAVGLAAFHRRAGSRNCPCALVLADEHPAVAAVLLDALAQDAASRGADRLQAVADRGADLSPWLQGGFSPWFTTRLMAYAGAPLPEPPFPIIPYTDAWYRPFQRLQSRAFFALRQAQDVRPYALQPTIGDRLHRAAQGEGIFLLLEGGRLAAAGAVGAMLDDVAVDEAFRGKGYGRAVVAHGTNRLLAAHGAATLEVLDWNKPALALYQSMGFTTTQRLQVLTHPLTP